jgi:hypothetical protein
MEPTDQPEQVKARVLSLVQRFNHLRGNRGVWESHWEEIAARVLPSYWHSFISRGLNTPGAKRTQEMYDATAALALPKFAAAMESMLTPRSSKWHRLVPADKSLMRNKAVRLWLDDLNDLLFTYRYAPRANYASQQHEIYMGLGAFGTGCLFVDGLDGGGIRYRTIHLGEVYFLENHQGIIDTCFRWFRFTARQAEKKWGLAALPSKIADTLKTKPEQEFEFLHVVMPREDLDPTVYTAQGMPFASYYCALEGNIQLSEGGYQTFPYCISRYVVGPGETYGRSPAMLALPAIKVLNEQQKTVLTQGHRAIDPVLLAHDDGVLDSFSLKPGALNFGGVSADGRPLIHALPVGNLSLAKEMMETGRATINDAFLVTLFQILIETPQMTATEVLERAREKGALLSPTMGRQQSESLGPMIEREIDLLMQQGRVPPMPLILRQALGEYKTEYDSPLSKAQKAEEAAGFMRTLQMGIEHATATGTPEAIDWLDVDAAMPAIADINAMPSAWIRTQQQVDAIRQGRAQQAQVQQAIEASPAVAGAVKALSPGAPK